MNKTFAGFALLLSLPALSFAGAWSQPEGGYWGSLTVSRFESDAVFNAKGGGTTPTPDFTEDSLSLYGEYGLGGLWTGVASVSAKSADDEALGTTSGLADAWFHLKKQLTKGPWILSIQPGVKIPMGYSRLARPPLGDGQIDIQGLLLLSRSLAQGKAFFTVEGGYRFRNGDVSNEIVTAADAGLFVHPKVLLKARVDRVESAADDAASKASNRHPNVFDEESTKAMGSLLWFIRKNWGVETGYETVLTGGNTGDGDKLFLGVFVRK